LEVVKPPYTGGKADHGTDAHRTCRLASGRFMKQR
jgi:hypothetical protein